MFGGKAIATKSFIIILLILALVRIFYSLNFSFPSISLKSENKPKKVESRRSKEESDEDDEEEDKPDFGQPVSRSLIKSLIKDKLQRKIEEKETIREKKVRPNIWEKRNQKYDDLNIRDEDMATPPQLRKIEAMWRDICYIDSPEFAKQSLRKFLQNKFKIADIKFLTKKKAIKVIRAIFEIKKK